MTGWIQKLYNQLESRALHTNRLIPFNTVMMYLFPCFIPLLFISRSRQFYSLFFLISVCVFFVVVIFAHSTSSQVFCVSLHRAFFLTVLWMARVWQKKNKLNEIYNGLDRESQLYCVWFWDFVFFSQFLLSFLQLIYFFYALKWNRKFNHSHSIFFCVSSYPNMGSLNTSMGWMCTCNVTNYLSSNEHKPINIPLAL